MGVIRKITAHLLSRLRRNANLGRAARSEYAPCPFADFAERFGMPAVRDQDGPRTMEFDFGFIRTSALVDWTGNSRPIRNQISETIRDWNQACLRNPLVDTIFRHEVAVLEPGKVDVAGDRVYWLPIQESLLPPLERLPAGAHLMLGVLYIGAIDGEPIWLINCWERVTLQRV